MADQLFDQHNKRFWMDLHKCATAEAIDIINVRIEECYEYGIEILEIVYGTPDVYKGSIQEAVNEIVQKNPKVEEFSEYHAGMVMTIKKNPNPSLQDEGMCFCGFEAAYENRYRSMEHTHDYYPIRKIFTPYEISKELKCPIEYVRKAANELGDEHAELKTIYNKYNCRDETTWYIYKSGCKLIGNRWQQDRLTAIDELKTLGASDSEIEDVLISLKTPLKPGQKNKARISAALTRVRSKTGK